MKRNLILESFAEISDDIWYERFDEFLNQDGAPIEILGCTYDRSFVLRKCDPIKYNYELERFKDLWESEYSSDEELEETVEVDGDTENIISDEENPVVKEDMDLEILLTSYDAEVTLGVADDVYYIKVGKAGIFNEIPAYTEEEAINYYDEVVADRLAMIEDEEEAEIAKECNRIWESRQQKKNKSVI